MMQFTLSIDKIEYALPKKKQTVEEVSNFSGISVEELDKYLGFSEKYITTDDQTALDLAEEAVYKLMITGTILPNAIDYIIYAHSGIHENKYIRSPSAKIQSLIKAEKAFCFEITNGCNSLNAAFHIANSLLNNSNSKKNILIVVSDTLSKYVDYSSKKNIMHFYMYSDGAAAILVNNNGKSNRLISSALYTDGNYADISRIKYKIQKKKLITPVMETIISDRLKCKLSDKLISNYIYVINKCIHEHGIKADDLKFLFLSQNSKKVLSEVLNYFNFNSDKIVLTGKNLGHVGAIDSIIAFHDSLISGKINSNDYVILAGTGVGFHWGAHLFQV